MVSKKIVITSLLILSTLLMASFSAIPVVGGHDTQILAQPTRAANENLEIENRTYKVSYLTGSEEWDTVYIRDNGTLLIEGATLKAKKIICRAEMEKRLSVGPRQKKRTRHSLPDMIPSMISWTSL